MQQSKAARWLLLGSGCLILLSLFSFLFLCFCFRCASSCIYDLHLYALFCWLMAWSSYLIGLREFPTCNNLKLVTWFAPFTCTYPLAFVPDLLPRFSNGCIAWRLCILHLLCMPWQTSLFAPIKVLMLICASLRWEPQLRNFRSSQFCDARNPGWVHFTIPFWVFNVRGDSAEILVESKFNVVPFWEFFTVFLYSLWEHELDNP